MMTHDETFLSLLFCIFCVEVALFLSTWLKNKAENGCTSDRGVYRLSVSLCTCSTSQLTAISLSICASCSLP